MKALVVKQFGAADALEVIDIAVPEPGRGQVRVKVTGAAVNQIDISTRNGLLTQAGLIPRQEMTSLGWDVSGVLDALGEDVESLHVGDPVIGIRDWLSQIPGAQSEYVVLPQSAVAPAPKTLALVDAAALPLSAVTAHGALEAAGLRRGDSLLVTGAAGAVGGYVLELARLGGIETVAVASAADEEFVRDAGARHLIERREPIAAAVRALFPDGVDAVIDAAGVVGIAAHEALRATGTFVALVRPFAPPPIRGTQVVVHESWADGARLTELSAMVDAGLLTVRVGHRFPLTQAQKAHETFEGGGFRGKVILVPSPLSPEALSWTTGLHRPSTRPPRGGRRAPRR